MKCPLDPAQCALCSSVSLRKRCWYVVVAVLVIGGLLALAVVLA